MRVVQLKRHQIVITCKFSLFNMFCHLQFTKQTAEQEAKGSRSKGHKIGLYFNKFLEWSSNLYFSSSLIRNYIFTEFMGFHFNFQWVASTWVVFCDWKKHIRFFCSCNFWNSLLEFVVHGPSIKSFRLRVAQVNLQRFCFWVIADLVLSKF